jgi:multisubunit Na+/H+ antiporter MnhB subunit
VAGVTTLVSVITLDRARAIGFGAFLLILMYLVTVIAGIEPSLENLKYLSAFHYYRPAAVIDGGAFPLRDLLLFGGVAIATWALAVWRFRSRDLVT